jgi:predicted SAM-dependent methyltransferase
MRYLVKVALTRALAPRERRRAAAFVASGRELRLHPGCGPNHLDSWVNIDLVSTSPDLAWDLSRQAPFPDGSIAAIFNEHMLEHLPLPAAIGFLAECHRLLRPGGVLRIGVPDFGRYARDYARDQELIARCRPRRPTDLMALSELVFCYEHASMWDQDTLVKALTEAGFESPEVKGFGESVLDPAPDSSWREPETLYVESVKPEAA